MVRRILIRAAAPVAAATFGLLAIGAPPAARAATTTVSVEDVGDVSGVFSPGSITISAGDSVQWNWTGFHQHSVTADDSSFDSHIQTGPAATFTMQFSTPGTFAYHCQIHGAPGGNGMSGTIVVQAAATSTPTSTATSAAATDTPASTTTLAASTNTPAGTATPAVSGTATSVSAPSATVAATVSEPGASQAPPTATSAGPPPASAQLPRTGGGPSGDASMPWLSIALAAAGAVTVGGAVALRRRRKGAPRGRARSGLI